jgi:drug/metabolite transporter (DMT)-like permease
MGTGLSLLVRGGVLDRLALPSGRWPTIAGYALANAVAFGLMFAALRRLGPTRTSVLLTIEVAATVVLAAVFLDETLRPIQLAGGAAIAAGAVLASLAHVDHDEPVPEPP